MSAQKSRHGSETRELLEGTQENDILPMKDCLANHHVFYEKQKNIIELLSRLLLEQASPLTWPAWHGEDIALPGARSETFSQTQRQVRIDRNHQH